MLSADLPENETQRIEALYSYGILDTATEQDFDDLTELASLICDVPIALVSFVDTNRQWFKSHKGMEATQTSREQSFCAHAINKPNEVMVVTDAHKDDRFKNNPLVTGWLNLTFYAGVPLMNEDGYALGSLCVLDSKKRRLTIAQTEALQTLARQVMDKLEMRRKNQRLAEEKERLGKQDTESRALHEKASANEIKFRNLVKQAPVAMATFMGSGYTIDLYNNKMLELWRRTAEEVEGLPLFAALPEVNDESSAELLKQVYTTGKGRLVKETPYTHLRNGVKETVWMDMSYEALRNEKGEITGIIVTGTDATGSVNAKREMRLFQEVLAETHKELKEKERNLRIANEAANLSMWMLEFETERITVSDSFRLQYGFLPEETLTIEKILNIVEPAYLPQLQQIITDAITMSRDAVVEYPILHPVGGERRWMRAVGKVDTDTEGRPVRFIGMSADITEQKEYGLKIETLNRDLSASNAELRKAYDELRLANNRLQQRTEEAAVSHRQLEESEENLRMALSAANLGMWMLNLKTDEYTVSEQFKALYGFAPGAKVTVEDVSAAVDERYRTLLIDTIATCIAGKGGIDMTFIIHKQDTGGKRWIRKLGKVLTDEHGNGNLFIGINADVTERKENDRKIQNLNDELIAMNVQMQSINDELLDANEELQANEEAVTASLDKLFAREEQMRIAAEAANFGMWDLNLQTGELAVSDNMKLLYGFAVTDVMTLEKYLSVCDNADREKLEGVIENATREGTPAYEEFYIRENITGERKRMRAVGKVHKDTENKPWRLIGMTADITEQTNVTEAITRLNADLRETVAKHSEQEEILQLALRSAHIGLWQIDLTSNATVLSARMKEIHGIPAERKITFDEALSTVAEEYRQPVNEKVVRALETGELFVAEYKINRMDGSGTGWVRSTGIVKDYEQGKRKVLIGACIDITAQKQDEEKRVPIIKQTS